MCYGTGGQQMHAKAVAFGVPGALRECSVTTRATM